MVLIGLLFFTSQLFHWWLCAKKSPSKCSVTFSSPNPTLKILFTRLMPDWFLAKISIMLWLLWCERILLLLLHDLVANTSRERSGNCCLLNPKNPQWLSKNWNFFKPLAKTKGLQNKVRNIMQFLAKITCYTLRGKWNKDQKDGF